MEFTRILITIKMKKTNREKKIQKNKIIGSVLFKLKRRIFIYGITNGNRWYTSIFRFSECRALPRRKRFDKERESKRLFFTLKFKKINKKFKRFSCPE